MIRDVSQNSTTALVRHFTAASDLAFGSSVKCQSIPGYFALEPRQETGNLQDT